MKSSGAGGHRRTVDLDARTGSVGAARPEHRRFDPMSGTWPMILLNVLAVLAVTSVAIEAARMVVDDSAFWLAYGLLGGGVLLLGVALPLRWFLMAQRRDADRREAMLVLDGQRRDFAARLTRALDMADDETDALHVAERAFRELVPDANVEVLLADSSQAHLIRAAVSAPDAGLSGCEVATPKSCPAVRNGHALRFDDADQLDACPHLRQRGDDHCGATCVPVSIMGSAVGVVHAVHRQGVELRARLTDGLDIVAQQLGGRIGLLSAMSQSQMQANTDPLTGLLNRRSLENEVRTLMRRDLPFALVLADLDHFKLLNDTYGHDTGDRALRLFARTVRRAMRDGDIVARYGGEEFVIVLPGLDAAGAARAFDRGRLELEVALSDGRIPPFTVSAGVVDTHDAVTLDELITLADQLLLLAKRSGRNQVLHRRPDVTGADATMAVPAEADTAIEA